MNQFHSILDEVSEKAGWSDDSLIYILCEYINSCKGEGIAPETHDLRQYLETQFADESRMTS